MSSDDYLAEIILVLWAVFRPAAGRETNLCATKPFFAFGAEFQKRRMVIKPATRTAGSAGGGNRRRSNANPQLRPYFRLRAGWPFDGRFVR
jgi:hypothetical protein